MSKSLLPARVGRDSSGTHNVSVALGLKQGHPADLAELELVLEQIRQERVAARATELAIAEG